MEDKTIAIYCIIDDILKAMNYYEDKRRNMNDAMVITIAIISSLFFSGNYEKGRKYMKDTSLVKNMLSKSRFCRRINAIADLVYDIFHQLGMILKEVNTSTEYIVDSFPVSICHNIRVARCRIARSKEFRGYISSKREYFFGVKVHVLTTSDGIPVELAFLHGCAHDSRGLDVLSFALPAGSYIYADSAYTDYNVEDALKDMDGIHLDPNRKNNSKRYDQPHMKRKKKLMRSRIETTFSQISAFFPKHIHAVTLKGLLLKVTFFIFAFTMNRIL